MKLTAIDNIIEKEKGLLVSVARAIGSTAGTVVARMNASTKPTHRTLSGTKTNARVAKSRKNNSDPKSETTFHCLQEKVDQVAIARSPIPRWVLPKKEALCFDGL